MILLEMTRLSEFLSKKVGAFGIAFTCMLPALLFIVYVCYDDARQSRAARKERAGAGPSHH